MVAQDSEAPASTPARKPDRKRLVIVLAVVAIAGGVFWYANRPEPVQQPQDVGLAQVEFPDHGFTIELPENWVFFEQERRDPDIAMVAGVPATQNNVRVRVTPLEQTVILNDAVPETTIQEFQAQFDKFIDDGEGVIDVMQRQRVRINGVQGFHYLYTFRDEPSGEEGVHSHFFLLGGDRLYTLVFQALPTSNYSGLARTFDEILTSFRLIRPEETAPPAPPPPAG